MKNWKSKINPLFGLVKKLGELPERRGSEDDNPSYKRDPAEVQSLPGYKYKNGSYDDPEVVEYWNSRGISFASREAGAVRWIPFMPRHEAGRPLPVLIVFHKEDYASPFWALKTLEHFSAYCNSVAEKLDHGILFLVTNNKPDLYRAYCGILGNAANLGADPERMYMDLSLLEEHGATLRDLEGFAYFDDDGNAVGDPDALVENFQGHPAINIANRCSEHVSLTCKSLQMSGPQDGTVDFEAIYHSETGRKLMEGISLEYRCDSLDDPGAKKRFGDMGLCCEKHDMDGVRWVTFVPACIDDEGDRELPLLAVFMDVSGPGDQSILTAASFYSGYLNIAAQGECILLFFSSRRVENSPEIIRRAAEIYPIDKSRIYVSGHSHAGHQTQALMRRIPHVIAAAAPLGNAPGIPLPYGSGEAVAVTDEDVKYMSALDIPTVIVSGCCEVGCMFPINREASGFDPGINVSGYAASVEGRAEAWNRRLAAYNCRRQSVEEILAAAESPNKATRELGVPSDSAYTLFMDGFEHYVADFKNDRGDAHLRIIGEENMPHVVTPSQLDLAWDFMRRFSRDPDTGAILQQ
jgi:hypothetical protein